MKTSLAVIALLLPFILSAHESNTAAQTDYTQTTQLHTGWNLVSWYLDIDDPDPGDWLEMQEILDPSDPANDWFFNNEGRVYTWEERDDYYPGHPPEAAQWEWDLDNAYYMLIDTTCPWTFANVEQYPLDNFTINPSDAWDEELDSRTNVANEWFFISYPRNGYTKIASEPLGLTSGDPEDYDYVGPFHHLFWHEVAQQYEIYDLKVVANDKGEFYIPPILPGGFPGVDQIGILEPGKGYFLGFYAEENETYEFNGWSGYPGWESLPEIPGGKESSQTVASTNHFQYNKYTHWSYPIVIDTID